MAAEAGVNREAEPSAEQCAELLEAERRRTEAVLESLTEGVIVLDAEGSIATCNSAALKHLHVTRDDVESFLHNGRNGKTGAAYVLEQALSDRRRRPRDVEFERRLPRTFDLPFEKEMFLTTPSRRTLKITSAPFLSDEQGFGGRVFTIRDITREKRINDLKDEFLAMVSHELRTPMTSVLGFASLALSRKMGALSDKQTRALNTVYRQAKRLDRLIDQLLDISRLERNAFELNLDEASVDQIVGQVITEFEIQAEQKGVSLAFSCPPSMPKVRADGDRIAQLFTALLDNAIKFSPEGGAVAVDAAADAGCVRVSVADQGPGIREDVLTHIFDKFYRGEDSETPSGLGLGLPIAAGIVQAHGGEISVETVPGRGSTFWFTVPIDGPAESNTD